MAANLLPANGHGLPSSRSALTKWIDEGSAASIRSTPHASKPRSAKNVAWRPSPHATSSTGPRSTSCAQRTTQSEIKIGVRALFPVKDEDMPSTAIRFGSYHRHELSARLELPIGAPSAFALYAHCFTCSKESKAAAYISQALAARSVAVLRFDFSSLEFSSNIADLVEAAKYLREHHEAPQILIGHSLGGAAVLAAAEQIPEARAVATIGAPFEARHVEHLIQGGKVDIGGRPFSVSGLV